MKMDTQTKLGIGWWVLLAAVVFGMKGVGEFYPISHFPMYSSLGDDAVVLSVRTGDGTPVPLLEVFGKRESRCKKIWKSKLREIANAAGHHSQDATLEEKSAAGEYLLKRLLAERYYGKLEAYGNGNENGELDLFMLDIVLTKDQLIESQTRIASASW